MSNLVLESKLISQINALCIPTSPAPKKPRRQPRAELRERIARCEELLERLKNSEMESPTSDVSMSAANWSHSPNAQPEPLQSREAPKGSTGKILIDQGAVRFTDKWLWAAMAEEVILVSNSETSGYILTIVRSWP